METAFFFCFIVPLICAVCGYLFPLPRCDRASSSLLCGIGALVLIMAILGAPYS